MFIQVCVLHTSLVSFFQLTNIPTKMKNLSQQKRPQECLSDVNLNGIWMMHSLELTAISHLKKWVVRIRSFRLWGACLFSGANLLLVSGASYFQLDSKTFHLILKFHQNNVHKARRSFYPTPKGHDDVGEQGGQDLKRGPPTSQGRWAPLQVSNGLPRGP